MKQTLSSRAMKNPLIVVAAVFAFICCLSLPSLERSASAQDKIDKNDPNNLPAPTGGGPIVTLTDGGVSVDINSLGRAGQTSPGCAGIGSGFSVDEAASVLCEHTDAISIKGGPVTPINAANCTIINPITPDSPSHATSDVQCSDATISFDHTVDGASGSWTTFVTITGVTSACYYPYTDYDVHGFANNGSSWHPDEGGGLGQFVVRNNEIEPEVHYLFTDMSGAVHWEQAEFPDLRSKIAGLTDCGDLADDPPLFNGDFTGALQFSFPEIDPKVGVTFGYSHSRDDSIPFEVEARPSRFVVPN